MNKRYMAWVLLLMPFFLNSGNKGSKGPQSISHAPSSDEAPAVADDAAVENEDSEVEENPFLRTYRTLHAQRFAHVFNCRDQFDADEQETIENWYDSSCEWLVFLKKNPSHKIAQKTLHELISFVELYEKALKTPQDGYEQVDAIPVITVRDFFNCRLFQLKKSCIPKHLNDVEKLHSWWHELLAFGEHQEKNGQAACISQKVFHEIDGTCTFLEERAGINPCKAPPVRTQLVPNITVFNLLPNFEK